MAKKAKVWSGTEWVDLAAATTDLSALQTKTATGLNLVIPTGATNGTVGTNGAVTIGSAVSSVTVAGAFSATYDAYKIIVTGGVSSVADRVVNLQLSGSTTAYYYSYIYASYTTGTPLAVVGSNVSSINYVGLADGTNGISVNVDVMNPFLAKNTTFMSSTQAPSIAGGTNGVHINTGSYTGFVLTPQSGTLTGGTIRIYGYNNGL
jgi:hypothetical protein